MVKSSDHQTRRHFGPDQFIGGVVALDFLNTVDNWHASAVDDLLPEFEDWLAWTRAAALPCDGDSRVSRPTAVQFMHQLRSFRAHWRSLLQARLRGTAPGAEWLQCLNRCWQRANDARDIRMTGVGADYAWNASVPAWECAFHAIVLSAAELLTDHDRLARVHECPGESCGWYFFDTSRNGSRRWCSMKTCGNVDKVRRFHERQRRR